jgi:uncharacterized membrane protein YqaE (UPF0057 family)
MSDIDAKDLVTLIATVLVPPLGVAIKKGLGVQFLVNLVLTVFGFYIAGLVHGLWVVLSSK